MFHTLVLNLAAIRLSGRMTTKNTSPRTARNPFVRVWRFYADGFRGMTLGRTLWAIILIKLFIMFAILKVFFFPNALGGLSQEERSDKVLENLSRSHGDSDTAAP